MCGVGVWCESCISTWRCVFGVSVVCLVVLLGSVLDGCLAAPLTCMAHARTLFMLSMAGLSGGAQYVSVALPWLGLVVRVSGCCVV